MEEVNTEFDLACRRYYSVACLDLRLDVIPDLVIPMARLSREHDFLPQMPVVGSIVTAEEEQQLVDWVLSGSEAESKGFSAGLVYGGLAAVGIGALLATIWSDVPGVRNLRVHATPTRTAVSTSLGW